MHNLAQSEQNKQTSEFRARLEDITSRQLDAQTVDTYADSAFNDLVALIGDATKWADLEDSDLSGQEKERRALSNLDVDPNVIEATLDHIIDVSDATHRLDRLITDKMNKTAGIVFVPPQSEATQPITLGDGSFEKPKENIPKLKTLLLLLQKGFDLNIEDPEQVNWYPGDVSPEMIREAPYWVIEVPSLSRMALVCDERGNATYVFDTAVCHGYGMDSSDLVEATKSELNKFIEEDPAIGVRLNYSRKYAERLGQALIEPFDDMENTEPSTQIDILKPKAPPAPEGYLSKRGIAKLMELTGSEPVTRAISELGDSLGEVGSYFFGSGIPAVGYSPDQIERISQRINIAPIAPPGYLSMRGLRDQYRVGPQRLNEAIRDLGDELGVVETYRFGARTTLGYSPDQAELIVAYLGIEPTAPDDYCSASGMSRIYGVPERAVRWAALKLDEQLGEVKRYLGIGSNRPTPHYSPEQVALILENIENNKKIKLSQTALDRM